MFKFPNKNVGCYIKTNCNVLPYCFTKDIIWYHSTSKDHKKHILSIRIALLLCVLEFLYPNIFVKTYGISCLQDNILPKMQLSSCLFVSIMAMILFYWSYHVLSCFVILLQKRSYITKLSQLIYLLNLSDSNNMHYC